MSKTGRLAVVTGWAILCIAFFAGVTCAADAASADPEFALLGELPTTFTVYLTEHYALAHTADETWAEQTGRLLESVRRQFLQDLAKAGFVLSDPPERLVWLCFSSDQAYRAYGWNADRAPAAWTAYYSSRTNRVAFLRDDGVRPQADVPTAQSEASGPVVAAFAQVPWRPGQANQAWPAVMSHEAAHQLAFNLGLQTRGVMYPLWVAEGIATNFEVDAAGRCGMGRDNEARRRDLEAAFRAGRLLPLNEFITLVDAAQTDRCEASVVYAQAWGLWRFLLQHRGEQLRSYLAAVAAERPGQRSRRMLRAEFVAAFGPIDRLEQPWRDFLAELPGGKTPGSAEVITAGR